MASDTSALEIVTVVIAGYAALVGTLALAFQIISWLRSWSTRVEVKLGRFQLASADAEPEAVVLLRMINHSGHPVKVTSVGTAPQRRNGPGTVIIRPWPLELQLPFTIQARDSMEVWTKPHLTKLTSIARFGRG